MSKRIGPITLDGETADRITLLNLKEYKSYLTKELSAWRKNPRLEDNPEGIWMHPEDVTGNIQAISALDLIIKHFGVEE
jgi:hypothetical protein